MIKLYRQLFPLIILLACQSVPEIPVNKVLSDSPLIPRPVTLLNDSSYLVLGSSFKIASANSSGFLEGSIQNYQNTHPASKGQTTIALTEDPSLSPEAYQLSIDKSGITLTSGDRSGAYWGWITLQQIIQLGSDSTAYGLAIPTGTITDQPRFGYRGIMLDIARHFLEIEEIKTIIDEITLYKINHLHLHLADDQGWRIEIKSWPNLTTIGGSTEVGGGKGGFLSQEAYKDLVQYAAERGITIVPEIDMPGHTNAALASYAELNCDGVARELYTGTEVGFSTLCTDKEIIYEFIDDVVREISEMTPGSYFHIGGDESHVTAHDDYIYFINRVRKIVANYNKIMVGWDEISEGEVDSMTTVQLWAHPDLAKQGMEKGANILFSLADKAYIDMKYDSTTELGLMWAGIINLPTAYNWDPTDYIEPEFNDQFIGLESPLWTETVTNVNEAEFMIFPRVTAYSEIGWTPKNQRSWENYYRRIKQHQKWWKDLEIDAYDGF